jgi:hypothetical protein
LFVGIEQDGKGLLPDAVDAGGLAAFLPGAREHGQKQAGKDGDDGNHDEQFDEREAANGL